MRLRPTSAAGSPDEGPTKKWRKLRHALAAMILASAVISSTIVSSSSVAGCAETVAFLPTYDAPQKTLFDAAAKQAFGYVVREADMSVRLPFDLTTWTERSLGGLTDHDRLAIAEIYSHANSVFEFGLGESTKIANHVGVPNYAGIDSDPVWVNKTRSAVASHFRFYFADIGTTQAWGYPVHMGSRSQVSNRYGEENEGLPKMVLEYQLAPLLVEALPFEVYFVDGRFRIGCVLTSFLHAAARGALDQSGTTVLLHDCDDRPRYYIVDGLFNRQVVVVPNRTDSSKLCSFHRRPETTDEMIFLAWNNFSNYVF